MRVNDYAVDLRKYIKNFDKIYAHIDGCRKETIIEHIDLCLKYLNEIIDIKKLDQVIDKIIGCSGWNLKDENKDLFFKLFINTVVFHDIGKINPKFQNDKMNNDLKLNLPIERNYQSKHSLLSSYLYIGYFSDVINILPVKEKMFFRMILYLNAFIISRHHSFVNNFDFDFMNDIISENDINNNFINWINNYIVIMLNDASKVELIKSRTWKKIKFKLSKQSTDFDITLYTYSRLLHSILVACDYYATSEFKNKRGIKLESVCFDDIIDAYNSTNLIRTIRNSNLDEIVGINKLRTSIFLEAEHNLINNLDSNVFYLEAPTGSGKSNTALNLSLQLVNRCENLDKIIYVYPFNTLVEQNLENLSMIFNGSNIMNQVATINSVTSIKVDDEISILYSENEKYQQALLDRQFMNYPIILTTHVSLFDTMFGNNRDSTFGFYQLINSVIVLDEIQSYRIEIWNEIIIFLKQYAKILNLKIIIMSATLPNLELLALDESNSVELLKNKEIYYQNPIFKNRVQIDYSLLGLDNIEDILLKEIVEKSKLNKRIMIEFISRKTADRFYRRLKCINLNCEVLFISGLDSVIERKKIINKVRKSSNLVLVATQVIEAGVDIDMDIGYKDISKLDSEEQFMGRINRSSKNNGLVYFFDLDSASKIYKNDERIDKRFTLKTEECRNILETKDFVSYYNELLDIIELIKKENNENNLDSFFRNQVGMLNYDKIALKMNLILDTRDRITIYLASIVYDDGTSFNGKEIWESYEELLNDNDMDYSKKIVELSKIKSKMNYFTYQVDRNCKFDYDKQIGDIYYIEEGAKYLEDGKLNMAIFDTENELFI